MSNRLLSIAGLLLFGALVLAACAGHPERGSTPTQVNVPPPPQPSTRPSQPVAAPAPLIPRNAAAPANAAPETPAPAGEMVGIAACDQYLSTYKACHRAAGIYPPGQIDAHYEAMRNGLLRDAADPAKRPILGQRCRALDTMLHDALHGKSCNAAPADASSSGT